MITGAELVEEMARLRDYLREQFPTKTELREHYATKADLKDMEIRLTRWMAATALDDISISVGLTAVGACPSLMLRNCESIQRW
jgi:hypothetical protein